MRLWLLASVLAVGAATAAEQGSPSSTTAPVAQTSPQTGRPAVPAPMVWEEPATGMRFVKLAKGCFKMGWPDAKRDKPPPRANVLSPIGHFAADETPRHEVCVDAFWLGQYEVQADEWNKVMGQPPAAGSGRTPAAGITWEEARAFAQRLGELSGGAYRFRLPTEAEWEYACRAGSDSNPYPSFDDAVEGAWYNALPGVANRQALRSSEVGKLTPNAWGLYDMLGNVWEWVEDVYRPDAYARHGLFNPVVSSGGQSRVIRGASYRSDYFQMRCSARGFYAAGESLPQVGLRLVRTP